LIASRISAGLPPWGAAMAATRSIRRRIVFGGLPTGGYNRAAPAMGDVREQRDTREYSRDAPAGTQRSVDAGDAVGIAAH
jgi:hypothetical protein